MREMHYIPIPCDEPPPQSMIREAQKWADNHDEPVQIIAYPGVVYRTVEPEV